MNWYYAENNERKGPVSETEFASLVENGKIAPATLVWNEEMTNWQPYREVAEPEEQAPEAAFLQGVAASAPIERNGPCWEERATLGMLNAAVKTVKEVIGNPDFAYSRMKRSGSWRGPLSFAVLAGGTGSVVTCIYNVIFDNGSAFKGAEALLASNAGIAALALFALFFIPIFIACGVLINSAVIHVSLTIMGVAKQPFETTWRVVCYSLGSTAVFQCVPLLGGVIAMIWNLISMVIGIAKAHEIPAGKAAFSIVPVVFLTGCAFVMAMRMYGL